MTDHTDEELIGRLRYQGKQYANGMRARGGYFIGPHWLEEVADRLEELNAIRQQDMARLARMREALNDVQLELDPTDHGQHGCECDPSTGYQCPACRFYNSKVYRIIQKTLSETSDIQERMDGQRAQWRTIETAPKDGKNILIYSKSEGVLEAFWQYAWYADMGKPGWMAANLDEEYGDYITDATHWMPLPAAPSARSTKGEG